MNRYIDPIERVAHDHGSEVDHVRRVTLAGDQKDCSSDCTCYNNDADASNCTYSPTGGSNLWSSQYDMQC